jgi:hypothetical protein
MLEDKNTTFKLEAFAKTDSVCREMVDQYYLSLLKDREDVSTERKDFITRLIKDKKLIPEKIVLDDYLPFGIFNPLLCASLNGNQALADRVYECAMQQEIETHEAFGFELDGVGIDDILWNHRIPEEECDAIAENFVRALWAIYTHQLSETFDALYQKLVEDLPPKAVMNIDEKLLGYACSAGNKQIVNYLCLDKEENLLEKYLDEGKADDEAEHEAMEHHRIGKISQCIENGLDVDAALYVATSSGHEGFTNLLKPHVTSEDNVAELKIKRLVLLMLNHFLKEHHESDEAQTDAQHLRTALRTGTAFFATGQPEKTFAEILNLAKPLLKH